MAGSSHLNAVHPRARPPSHLLPPSALLAAGRRRPLPARARQIWPLLVGSGDPPVESAVAAPSCSPPSPVVLPATGRRPADSGRLCLDPATTRLDPVPPCPWGFPSDPLGGPPRRPAAVFGGTARGRPMAEGSGVAHPRLPTLLALSGHAPRHGRAMGFLLVRAWRNPSPASGQPTKVTLLVPLSLFEALPMHHLCYKYVLMVQKTV